MSQEEMSPEELERLKEVREKKEKAIRDGKVSKTSHERELSPVERELRNPPPPTEKPAVFSFPHKSPTPVGFVRKYYFVGEGGGFESFKFIRCNGLGEHLSKPIRDKNEAVRWHEVAKGQNLDCIVALYHVTVERIA